MGIRSEVDSDPAPLRIKWPVLRASGHALSKRTRSAKACEGIASHRLARLGAPTPRRAGWRAGRHVRTPTCSTPSVSSCGPRCRPFLACRNARQGAQPRRGTLLVRGTPGPGQRRRCRRRCAARDDCACCRGGGGVGGGRGRPAPGGGGGVHLDGASHEEVRPGAATSADAAAAAAADAVASSAAPPAPSPLPPWARRTTDEEIAAARLRAVARIAARGEAAGEKPAGARAAG